MKTKLTMIFILILSIYSSAVMPKSISRADQVRMNVNTISKMIKVVQPDLNKNDRNRIAFSIYSTSRKYGVDPKIMIAIIGTESDFRNHKISNTGDVSMAQINPKVWNKEFERIGLPKLNVKKLKKDETYALSKMAKILTILKERHAKKDKQWFARYHSQTKKYKQQYSVKVEKRLRMIASIGNTYNR